MKRISYLIISVLFTLNCYAQDENMLESGKVVQQDIIVGFCNVDSLKQEPFSEWFTNEYENYNLDFETLDNLNPDIISEFQVLIVLGTWCEDSQRETPRFFKIIDYLGLSESQVKIIGVDKDKKAGDIPIGEMVIDFVPTFIFYTNGEEIGRIIESPEESLEKDFVEIISSL